jgi:hypothetical protein
MPDDFKLNLYRFRGNQFKETLALKPHEAEKKKANISASRPSLSAVYGAARQQKATT